MLCKAFLQIALLFFCCTLIAANATAQDLYYDSTAHSIIAQKCRAEHVVQMALQNLWPDTESFIFYLAGSDSLVFTGTLQLTRDTSTTARKQFLLYMDSVLGTTSVVAKPRPLLYPVIFIRDSALLATFEDPSGKTFTEIINESKGWNRATTYPESYLHKRYRWKYTHNNDTVDKQLRQMGADFRTRWLSFDEIHVRPAGTSEDVLLYHIQNYQFHPTVGATILANSSDSYLAGAEVGLIYGILMSGHGNYGISGIQTSVEYLTNGSKSVIGINSGINLSAFFVIRLRAGIYSDFGKNVTLMALPEIGFSHNGRYGATIGGHLPILGSNAFESSFRFSLFYNFLPKGAR